MATEVEDTEVGVTKITTTGGIMAGSRMVIIMATEEGVTIEMSPAEICILERRNTMVQIDMNLISVGIRVKEEDIISSHTIQTLDIKDMFNGFVWV